MLLLGLHQRLECCRPSVPGALILMRVVSCNGFQVRKCVSSAMANIHVRCKCVNNNEQRILLRLTELVHWQT